MSQQTGPAAAKPRRPIRDNLDALGIAILFAVLFKPLLIEAYQIPTPSMQPTMMGSKRAGVHDRLLVDKLRYTLTEPKRWDISVFRYPIRENQSYVKRIVGMPGDLLRIGGGNIYQVTAEGVSVERKPGRIQERLWKEIYPLRRRIVGSDRILGDGNYFLGTGGDWGQDGDDLTVTATGTRRVSLRYLNQGEGGISNRLYDGYPVSVAAAIKKEEPGDSGTLAVQDVRCSFVLTPKATPTRLTLEIGRGGSPRVNFRLEVENGSGRLLAIGDSGELASSPPFPCALAAGAATSLSFAHVDDVLLATHDGERVELDCGATALLDELRPGDVSLRLEIIGGEQLRLADLRVERDLHYTTTGLTSEEREQGLAVPAGHYLMLGDNTQASADARQWQVFTVGVLADGRMVDPARHPEARKLRGNLRPWSLDEPPDADENPVIIRGRDRVVFTDELGECVTLRSAISSAYGPRNGGPIVMMFRELDAQGRPTDHEWTPETAPVHYVPRDDLLGRPVLCFFPIWPLGPNRVGFIR